MRLETRIVQFEAAPGDGAAPSATPIYQTATFEQETVARFGKYDYSRSGNPTRSVLEGQLARLDGGAGALAYASGMAAIAGVLGLLRAGDEVLAGDDLYGGTFRLLERVGRRRGLTAVYADPCEAEGFAEKVTARTRLVHVETPSNPLLRIVDIGAVVGAVRRRAGELGIEAPLVCVDGTAMSPYLQNPLGLGADLVVHSATKLLCGHGDVSAGVVCAARPKVVRELAFGQNAEGTALGPMDSFLLLRGMKTLAVRIRQQQETAGEIARVLEREGLVERVYYPGLAGHPGAEVHGRQARGGGCVVSVRVGSRKRAVEVAGRLRLFSTTVSFGSVHSSVCLPASMSHGSVPEELRERVRPPEDLLRLSVGVEDGGDLMGDLRGALGGRE